MNKISVYILLIFFYLGLSKSFSPTEQSTPYIPSEHFFSKYYQDAPLNVILIDQFQTGFIIKTHYQRYLITHGFKNNRVMTVRTSGRFWRRYQDLLGMSIFRRNDVNGKSSIVPLPPPGTLFIGDPTYGTWGYDGSGEEVWMFSRAYRHFPDRFGWGSFAPTKTFYQMMMKHEESETPFFGLHHEFGTNGKVSKEFLARYKAPPQTDTFEAHLKKLFSLPTGKNVPENK